MNINSLIRHKFFSPALLFIICFILYGNTLHNEYVFDDYLYTNNNELIVKGFSAFKDIFEKGSFYSSKSVLIDKYRPVTLLNFLAEVSIFGFNRECKLNCAI